MTRKEKLVYLLKHYCTGDYDTVSFCDQFVPIYSENIGDSECTPEESELFEAVCRVSERFSPYEDDLKLSDYFIDALEFNSQIKMILTQHASLEYLWTNENN